jgi:glycosyltransferase involved in cell wall biosynthesis
MEISVVIPTFNHAAFLGRTLASLCEQTLDPSRFEICVIDRGSTDVTAKVVDLVAAHYPRHKIIRIDAPRIDSADARNVGARQTTAPLIVQGHEDVLVPLDGLEKFIAGFAAVGSDVGKIGGEVVPMWDVPRPDWLSDGIVPLLIEGGFGCYRRAALEQAGGFPVVSDRKGNSLLSVERAADLVLKARGWGLLDDPSIVGQQAVHADRLTPLWFRRRSFWQGVSDHAVGVYLAGQGITAKQDVAVDLPLDAACWAFINNANEAPREDDLTRLRGLGRVLAQRGFVPL